ncbi:hypothetical protein TVAGG3_0744850 [Trichomonas vaginalis G3]|nr:hypothetical protein TVAGG3_0744850 [Trichomonas vaginalis G3]KAI5512094.1 hypothetical protein TVAGG3_0744850 [Trichomonas vaginalis G3]
MQSQIAEDLQEQLLDVQDQLTKLRQKYINSDKPKLEDKNEVSIKKYNDLKVKYQKLKSIDVHLKKEIQDLKSSISETSKISKLTQDSVSEGINPLKIQNDSIIDSPENGMSSEYSQNSANHNNFSKELKVERHRRINAQKEIIALKKNIKDLQQKLKSKEEKETTNDDIEILNQRADKAENEVLVQKALYSQLKQNYDTLMQTISVLRSENAAMLDEKGKLFEKISSLEKSVRTSANESIEKDAYRLKYSDSLCEKRNIEQKFEEAQTEIKRLNHEIIRLEAMLTKTKDENYKNTETIKVYENDMLTLSRYGFLLADALGQRFNPQNVEIEIERLLEIVKEEHQEYMMFHPPQYRETCSECGRPLY